VVAVALSISRDTGDYLGIPELVGRGLTRDEERVLEGAGRDLLPRLEELSRSVRGDDAFLREALIREVRHLFRERTGRRPVVLPLLFRV
jgi:ribonuclease J